MSDEVRQAAFIGGAINRGAGSIPVPQKKKKQDAETDSEKKPKKVKSTRTNAPTSEKKDKNIIDAVIVEPKTVTSERINTPKELTAGSSYTPTVGKQFKGFGPTYGSTHTAPATDLSKF